MFKFHTVSALLMACVFHVHAQDAIDPDLAELLARELPTQSRVVQSGDVVSRLEDFIERRAESPFTPAIRNQLAGFYRNSGRYQRAMDHWANTWSETAALKSREEKKVANEAVAHLAHQLASLGEVDLLEQLYTEVGNRTLDTHILTETYLRSWEKYGRMKHRPETSFLCGVVALDKIAEAMNAQHDRSALMNTHGKP